MPRLEEGQISVDINWRTGRLIIKTLLGKDKIIPISSQELLRRIRVMLDGLCEDEPQALESGAVAELVAALEAMVERYGKHHADIQLHSDSPIRRAQAALARVRGD